MKENGLADCLKDCKHCKHFDNKYFNCIKFDDLIKKEEDGKWSCGAFEDNQQKGLSEFK